MIRRPLAAPLKASTQEKSPAEDRHQETRLGIVCRRVAKSCSADEWRQWNFPGGESRRSFRLLLKNRDSVIVSIRPTRQRARTECKVLSELSSKGANVPRLIADDGRRLLIQEEIPGVRLSQAMHEQDEEGVERMSGRGADEPGGGASSRLRSRVRHAACTRLGKSFKWLVGLLDRPAVIGNYLNVPAPRPDFLTELEALLAVRKPRFVKWDSRPGNAMVRDDGTVYWFDWEHCGSRNRLDDVAWLLADEYVPDYPDVEERLIEKHIGNFADDLSIDEAKAVSERVWRLSFVGEAGPDLQIPGARRLVESRVLPCRRQGRRDLEKHAARLSTRERWANRNPHTVPLARWFMAIADQFETRSLEESVHVR